MVVFVYRWSISVFVCSGPCVQVVCCGPCLQMDYSGLWYHFFLIAS